jgi:hypothetical protein
MLVTWELCMHEYTRKSMIIGGIKTDKAIKIST